MTMTQTIKVPDAFYGDHLDRGLPTPEDVGGLKTRAVVRADDPALASLLDDAEYYAVQETGGRRNDCMPRGIVSSAQATVRAIRAVIGWEGAAADVVRKCRR